MENGVLPMQKWKTVTKLISLHLYAPGPNSFKIHSIEVIVLNDPLEQGFF